MQPRARPQPHGITMDRGPLLLGVAECLDPVILCIALSLAAILARLLWPLRAVPIVLHAPGSGASAVAKSIGATCGFRPTFWLNHGYLQTIWFGAEYSKPPLPKPIEEQRWKTEDGGTLALIFPRCDAPANATVVLIFPGLGGCAQDCSAAVTEVLAVGLRPVVMHGRGLNTIPLSSPRFNLMGSTADVRAAISRLQMRFPSASIALIGISIGSAAVVRYLGDEGGQAPILAAVLNCPGYSIDVAMTRCWSSLIGLLIDRYSVASLKAQLMEGEAGALLRAADAAACVRISNARNMHEFLVACAPFAGPGWDYAEFLRHSNPILVADRITVPVLCLNADDDPLCVEANVNDHLDLFTKVPDAVLLKMPAGGHCGFFEGHSWPPRHWGSAMASRFIKAYSDHTGARRAGRRATSPISRAQQKPPIH